MFNAIINKGELLYPNEKGNVAICTCWTPKSAWEKWVRSPQSDWLVQSEQVAVVGNLYTEDGIANMIRNLLANPQITELVVTGMDTHGVLRAKIIKAFADGYTLKTEDGGAYVGLEHLSLVVNERGVTHIGTSNKFKRYADATLTREPLILLPPPVNTDADYGQVLPAIGHSVHARTFVDAYAELTRLIRHHGVIFESRYGQMKELLGMQITFDDLGDPSTILTVAKAEEYARRMHYAEDAGTTYNYGERLARDPGIFSLVERAIGRAAYWPVYEPNDYYNPEPPCLVSVWLRVRDKEHLDGIWSVRSQDMGSGWPYNAYAWYRYQESLAEEHGLQMGRFATYTMSAHLYERDWESEEDEHYLMDPYGDWAITVEEKCIRADLMKNGEALFRAEASSAYGVQAKISHLVRSVDHAMYLGRELQKAEQRLRGEGDAE